MEHVLKFLLSLNNHKILLRKTLAGSLVLAASLYYSLRYFEDKEPMEFYNDFTGDELEMIKSDFDSHEKKTYDDKIYLRCIKKTIAKKRRME